MLSCRTCARFGRDAVVEEREREVLAGGVLAVADEVRDAGQRPRLALAAARRRRCPRIRSESVPLRPATAMSSRSVVPERRRGEVREQRRRPAAGEVWSSRESPEPSTTCGCRPSRGERFAHDARAGGGRAGAAEARAERLEQRLGEEVVRRRQRQARAAARSSARRRRESRRARRRARGAAARRGPRRRRAFSASAQLVRRVRRGRVRPAVGAALAAVERECAERPFQVGVRRVAAGGLAAQRVEVGLVALDRAADACGCRRCARAASTSVETERPEAAVVARDERARAERRVAAAVQVEVAFPDAARREVAGAETVVSRRASGPKRSSAVVAV